MIRYPFTTINTSNAAPTNPSDVRSLDSLFLYRPVQMVSIMMSYFAIGFVALPVVQLTVLQSRGDLEQRFHRSQIKYHELRSN